MLARDCVEYNIKIAKRLANDCRSRLIQEVILIQEERTSSKSKADPHAGVRRRGRLPDQGEVCELL